MQDSPFEQILVLIFFLLIALLQVFLERKRKRTPDQIPDTESELPDIPPPPSPWVDAKPPLIDHAIVTIRRKRLRRPPGLEVRQHPGLGSRLELRQAVVLSVILGPCRAKDPPA